MTSLECVGTILTKVEYSTTAV